MASSDIYVSATGFPRPLQPVLLFVHGGGWVRGDRQHDAMPGVYDNVGAAAAKAGVVGVVISYRLSPGVRHPEHTRDVAR
jgi:acetyl esterase/lipase